MWNLRYNTNGCISEAETDTDIENRIMLANMEEGAGVQDWEFEIIKRKLLYTGWINNKVLLYSTGNYIQYHVINNNGKEYEKEHAYV